MKLYAAGVAGFMVLIGLLFVGKVFMVLALGITCFLLGRLSTKVLKVGKL